jgi:hypothetical protein
MWDAGLDQQLIQLREQGFTYAEVARRMGISRGSALSRMAQISGKVFPYRLAARQRTRENRERRAAARIEEVARLRAEIRRAQDRNRAIKEAYRAGHMQPVIAEAAGISTSRVQQILVQPNLPSRPRPKRGKRPRTVGVRAVAPDAVTTYQQ